MPNANYTVHTHTHPSVRFSKEAISEYKCDVGQLLQMNFTHRNCLVAIGATRANNCDQMDT